MAMRRIVVVGDERKGGTKALVRRHAEWLRRRGCEVRVVTDRESSLVGLGCDCVIVFGGDGSLLGAARRMGDDQRPTLGINCGRLGFLTAFEKEATEEALERLLAEDLHEERRRMLRCSTRLPDGTVSPEHLVLNDVVVSRRAVGGMVTLRAWRGDLLLASYCGDGLIAATASGSTAYSMAVGGPVLAPDLDALVLSPLASHTLNVRPLVLPVDGGIDVEVVDSSRKSKTTCQMDGQISLQVPVGSRALLRPAGNSFRHLVPGATHFFEVLRAKFGFADLPRVRH